MKKIDPTIKRETLYIAAFVLILSVLMQSVFLIIDAWDFTVLFGNLLGAVSAVANFFFMALSVQKALGKEPQEAKNMMRFSQTGRYFAMIVVAVIGYFCPAFHVLAVVIPFLFPRVALLFRGLFPMEKD